MWAAYQGDALSVELFLKHGGSPIAKDSIGLTPLHWAVVRGNRLIIRKLIEAGADPSARDDAGKTAKDMAVELKSLGAYKRALEEGGFGEDGRKSGKPLSERNSRIAIFLLPVLFFYLIFTTLSVLPWYTSMPLALAAFFGMHHVGFFILGLLQVSISEPCSSDRHARSPQPQKLYRQRDAKSLFLCHHYGKSFLGRPSVAHALCL